MYGKCLICGGDLKYSAENRCGGHGIFYNDCSLSCLRCNITIRDNDYMHSVTFSLLEKAHDDACRDVIKLVLSMNQ